MRTICVSLALVLAALSTCTQAKAQDGLRVLSWNIWHGGLEDGEPGLQRTIETIEASGADLVAMQETYGSGERIAKSLGFAFHPRGRNVSIHSRFPVIEDISVHKEFQCVGALIELPDQSRIAFYSIWLPYRASFMSPARQPLECTGPVTASGKSARFGQPLGHGNQIV